MYTSDPIPRREGPPASATPLRDFLAEARLGVDDDYVVLPRRLAESMALPWQQQLAFLLGELHQAYGDLVWPRYRVVPSRTERLVDLDEAQLAEAGYTVEMDQDGELIYHDREGTEVVEPAAHRVLVACLDPIPRTPPPPAAASDRIAEADREEQA